MGKAPSDFTGNWAYQPVDPVELARRLDSALGTRCFPSGASDTDIPALLVSLPMPPVTLGASEFRDRYLMKEVLRKCPSLDLGIDTKAAALAAWLADEALNQRSNDRLYTVTAEDLPLRRLLWLASEKIARVLGPFCPEEFLSGWRFGPGSTLSITARNATVRHKLATKEITVSRGAAKVTWAVIQSTPAWKHLLTDDNSRGVTLTERDYDQWMSVAKNAKTDRSIGKPPDGNVILQLSLGKMMRRRLYRKGINLQDQSINQRRAVSASADGKCATVDVRAASQSIVSALVYLLFGTSPQPEDGVFGKSVDIRWFQAMEMTRTPFTLLPDGSLHTNAYFSAMGNGYTFELESLIFWALASAVCETLGLDPELVSVYGDDIILPSAGVTLLKDLFAYCGLDLNLDKSFYSPEPGFRESCGVHALRGELVNPFYVDSGLDQIGTIVLLANNITRWSVCEKSNTRDGRLFSVWQWVVSHLPLEYLSRYHIPLGNQDDGLILDWDEVQPTCAFIQNDVLIAPGCKTPVGWNVRGAFLGNRSTKTEPDRSAYVEALYHGSMEQKRFQPPRPIPNSFTAWNACASLRASYASYRDMIDATFRFGGDSGSEPDESLDPDPWRSATSISLIERRRVVLDWPRMGPWSGVVVVEPALAFSLPLLNLLKEARQVGGCATKWVTFTSSRKKVR